MGSVVYGVLVLIGVLPHVFTFVGLSQRADSVAAIFRWPVILLIVMIGLSSSTALVRAAAMRGGAE